MMDCEQLRRERLRGHRPHQPRLPARRDRAAGPDRRHLPAQGLRLLRGALERAGHAARRLARATSRCRCSSSRACKRRLGSAQRPQGRGARAGLQARHRRRARLAGPQARAPARARAGRRRRARPARRRRRRSRSTTPSRDADAVVVATNHSSSTAPARLRRDRRAGRRRVRWSSIPGTASAPRRCSPTAPRSARWRRRIDCREPRARHRAAPARSARRSCGACCRDPAYEVRVSDQRAAPDWMREGCEVHTGDLRDLDAGARGDARLHAT